MDNKRKSVMHWKTKLSTPFIIISISGMLLFTLMFSILVSITMSDQVGNSHVNSNVWRISFLVFMLIQLIAQGSLLALMFTVLHRTIGAFPRIGNNLDKVIAGDYSIRIGLRNKDNEHVTGLVNKLNLVLDILENKAKQK